MNQQERDALLVRSLQMLAEIEAAGETSPRVETAVMARWDAAHTERPQSQTRRVVRGTAMVAAGITLVGALVWPRDAYTPEPARDASLDSGTYTTVAVVGGPLMDGEPIRVVRMRVTRSMLGELGVPSSRPRGAAADAAQ